MLYVSRVDGEHRNFFLRRGVREGWNRLQFKRAVWYFGPRIEGTLFKLFLVIFIRSERDRREKSTPMVCTISGNR